MNETEEFITFTSVAPDLKRGNERQLEQELFKKNWSTSVIDEYEKRMGIPTKKANDNANRVVKTKTFRLEYNEDALLLNELMNSPKYNIIYWKDTWTVDGYFRVFAIYSDNQEVTKKSETK